MKSLPDTASIGLREGLMWSLAALGPTLLLTPHALAIAEGVVVARRPLFAFLLLETTYLLVGAACLGTTVSRRHLAAGAASLLALPAVVCILLTIVFGVDVPSLLGSQSAAMGTAVLGWGAGRAARGICGRAGSVSAVALLLVAAVGIGLLPVSHIAPLLEASPSVGETMLAANPFIAVTSAGGYDLIRSRALYDSLTLSSYRFIYPDPLLPPLVLSTIGLVLAYLGTRKARRAVRETST